MGMCIFGKRISGNLNLYELMKSRRTFLKTTMAATPVVVMPGFIQGFSFAEDLPNVLLLGDSISIGYTPFVREMLKLRANVFRPMQDNGKPENCAGTTNGVEHIDRWLRGRKWTVIHFNFGLHDLKHVDPVTRENSNNPDHPQQADPKIYRKNMEIIVEKLKATGAKLIFATTTPYPDKVNGPLRLPGMPEKYNRIAVKIMNRNQIGINDLYAFMLPRMKELQLPENVHFTEEGSRALAEKVTERIKEALDELNP